MATLRKKQLVSSIAYKDEANTFTIKQTYNVHPTFTSDTDIIDKKYADDTVDAKAFWARSSATLFPVNAGDKVDLGTGNLVSRNVTIDKKYYYNSSNPTQLTVGASPNEIIVGGYHAKYSTISSALSAESGKKLYHLLPETFSGSVDLGDETAGCQIYGKNSAISGNISLNSSSSIDVSKVTMSGTYGISCSGSSYAYFKAKETSSGGVSYGCLGNNVISEIKNATIDSDVFIGSSSTTVLDVISDNDHASLSCSSANSYYIRNGGTGGLLSSIANKVEATPGSHDNYFINATTNSKIYTTVNSASNFDYILKQTTGSTFINGNYLSGNINVSGGYTYLNATNLNGNIAITASSTSTSYINIGYCSGSITRSYADNLVGIIGTDNGLNCYTGEGLLNLMGRGASTTGGGINFKDGLSSTYSDMLLYRSERKYRFHVDVDSSLYEAQFYNSYSGRSLKIYNDRIASSNGTVYANDGYLTRVNPSDRRLKKNIVPIDVTGISDKIATLSVCTYNWKTNGSKGISVIAQEFQKVFPDTVEEDEMVVESKEKGHAKFETRLGFNDRWMWYHLAATIDLTNRVQELETQIKRLIK